MTFNVCSRSFEVVQSFKVKIGNGRKLNRKFIKASL